MIKLLINEGAYINIKNCDGYTPLCYAAVRGHSEVSKYLYFAGASVNKQNGNGYTPFYYAAAGGHSEVSKIFMNAGTSILPFLAINIYQ